MVEDIFKINKVENEEKILSKVISAAILHDSVKYGTTFDLRSYPIHPFLPHALYSKVVLANSEDRAWIFKAIESHDGGWSLFPEEVKKFLKEDRFAATVHRADVAASREDYIDERFKDVNKDVDLTKLGHFDPFPDNILRGLIMGVILEKVGDEDKLVELIKNKSIDAIFSRVTTLREPYFARGTKYNYEAILKYIRDNYEKFI